MATTSTRSVTVGFTGDIEAPDLEFDAQANSASPAKTDLVNLASGANTITVPSGGSTPVAVTIIPPAGNVQSITLKGVTGDTGVRLRNVDPTTLSLDPSVTSFCLTAGAAITGVRLVWS